MHDNTYDKTCATSKDSDQPGHLHSPIRVFADRMCLLQLPRVSKKTEQEHLLYWVDIQADLSICWSQGLIEGFVVPFLVPQMTNIPCFRMAVIPNIIMDLGSDRF